MIENLILSIDAYLFEEIVCSSKLNDDDDENPAKFS